MQIEINGLAVKISEKTLDAYDAHSAYCTAGINWLLRNDSKGKQESKHIQEVLDSLSDDYKLAVDNMLLIVHDSLMNAVDFNNQHDKDFFELIEEAMKSA